MALKPLRHLRVLCVSAVSPAFFSLIFKLTHLMVLYPRFRKTAGRNRAHLTRGGGRYKTLLAAHAPFPKLTREFRDNLFAYLRRRELLFLLQAIGHQRLVNARRAVRRMIVLITAMQALMAEALIAVAIAWKLRQRFRYLSGDLISLPRLTKELHRVKRRLKRACALRVLEVSRNPFRLWRDGNLIHVGFVFMPYRIVAPC